MMTREMVMTAAGGPEVLATRERDLPAPAAGEILLRQTSVGVNFIDVYHRTGLYPLPALPAVLGVEGAGVVTALGDGVTDVAVGDRVAYAGAPVGAYATARVLPAARVIRLPKSVPDVLAATALMKGLTAHMLLFRVARVGPGSVVLVHAAAGGLGSVLVAWAKRLGARVIGTVGSDEKAELAREAGADDVVVGRAADFVQAVLRFTDGHGADVAYDGIGGTTLAKTLACVRPFGTVASIGQAGGPIPPIDVNDLGPRRSLSLARPSIMAYVADTEAYRASARAVLDVLEDGLRVAAPLAYPLVEAARAHADLEAGRTTGSLHLLP